MKELTLFYLEECPHCKRARAYMDELRAEVPAYADIPVRMIEERAEKEIADRYDYYYVPCYFSGEEKLAEGRVDKNTVREIFERFLSD